jgi:sugar lactone lactonase YvrE
MKKSRALILRGVAVACLSLAGCSDDEEPINPPSRAGVTEIVLPGSDFYPEGIAVASDNTLYVGSVTTGQIIQVKPGSAQAEDFAAAKSVSTTGVVGLYMQRDQKYLWVCSNVFGTTNAPELIAVDPKTAQAVHRHTFPEQAGAGSGFCNEIGEDSAGNIYATDSFLGRVIRVKADQAATNNFAEVFVSDAQLAPAQGQFGLNGITFDGQGSLYVVKTGDGKLFRIPIAASGTPGTLEPITLDKTLMGPDGLKFVSGLGLIVAEQYGKALSRITLSGAGLGAVTRLQEGLADPSSVEIAEESAWVSEGQLSTLVTPGAPPPTLPFKVRRVQLPK